MKSKIAYLVVLCLCIVFLLSACTIEDGSRKKFVKTLDDFPLMYVKEGEILKFNADVIVKNDTKYLYKSIAMKSELKNKAVLSLIKDNVDDTFINENGKYYIAPNGNILNIRGNYLSFNSNSKLEKSIKASFSLFPEQYTAGKYAYIENLNILDSIKGKTEIYSLLSLLKIEDFALNKAYLLDYKTLQENENHIDKYGNNMVPDCNKTWTEEDNSVYWIGIQIWQGLPVFCSSYCVGISDAWMPIQVLYTQNGIEKLQILYCFKFKKETERITLKTFDEVADALAKKYSMLLTDNRYLVTKAELFFWVDVNQEDGKFQMKPVWNFTLREYKKDLEKNYTEYQELVNAETAEILEVGE